MITYETYKFLHLVFIFILLSSLGFIASTHEGIQKKSTKIFIGVISFLILVAGMGLIARLGFKHSEPFPLWIVLKMINWGLINVFLVMLYKIKKKELKPILITTILFFSAATLWIAINKPL